MFTRQVGTAVLISSLVSALLAAAWAESQAQVLPGKKGASVQWASGWLDLSAPTAFYRGDRLRIRVGGTAKKILIRLLPSGGDAGQSSGAVATVAVPDDQIVEITLTEDRPKIQQISVHGGANPWGQYPLGPENGPATLESVTLIRGAPTVP